MISQQQIGWIAGIVEGEGCLYTRQNAGSGARQRDGYRYTMPMISIVMTDRDILDRLAELFGGGTRVVRHHRANKNPKHKDAWAVHLYGKKCVAWLFTLYPLLGIRRRSKAREVIATWAAAPVRKIRVVAECHPDRPHRARGLCNACYCIQKYRRKAA